MDVIVDIYLVYPVCTPFYKSLSSLSLDTLPKKGIEQ